MSRAARCRPRESEARWLLGTGAAFAEFVAARSGALHRAAYLMVGDVGLAQDLVQEALTKTYVAWPRLRDPANAEAYTRKAITTTAITWFRKKSWYGERPAGRVPETSDAGHADAVAVRTSLMDALAAAATAATSGHRAPLLRGPHRGSDRGDARLRRRHREEPGLPPRSASCAT